MNLQRTCRLCSLRLHNPHDIFRTLGLLEKILNVTDIQIQKGDGLPSSICDACYVKVKIADKFRLDVKKADIRIRSTLEQSTSNLTHQRMLGSMIQTNTYKWCHENASETPQSDCQNTLENCRQVGSKSFTFQNNYDYESDTRLTNNSTSRRNFGKLKKVTRNRTERSLIYSNTNCKILAESYKTLIDHCQGRNIPEDFLLPCQYAASEHDSSEKSVSMKSEFLGKTDNPMQVFDMSLQNVTRTVINHDYTTAGIADHMENQNKLLSIQKDPFNLLKVKNIKPLSEREVDNVSTIRHRPLSLGKRPTTPMTATDCKKKDQSCQNTEDQEICDEASSFSTIWGPSRLSLYRNEGLPTNNAQSRNALVESVPLPTTMKRGSSVFQLSVPVDSKQSEKYTHESDRVMINCPVCGKVCLGIHGVQVHMRCHIAHSCPLCGASTVSKNEFRDHMKKKHIDGPIQPVFQCELCKSAFKSNLGLMSHMRAHSRSVHALNQCPHCAKTYITELGLRKHLIRLHK